MSTTVWLILLGAILLEVSGTTAMKLSNGLTKVVPSMMMLGFYGASFVCLALTFKVIDVSLAYPVWAGLGTAYRLLGKYQEALLAHVEGMKTGDADSANVLGWTEALMDGMMFGNAIAAYDQFAAENPERAGRMMGVMESWLAKRRQNPGDVDPANLDRLAEWIASKKL